MEWTGCLDEYQKLVNRMNTPRVVIDNVVCATATLVKVDSLRKHGILLEAIQVLTDLNLSINKAYISSDGRWFMNVFHVTDQYGHKLTDASLLSYIEQSLVTTNPSRQGSFSDGLTTLELTGGDRPGLLSEIFAVLYDLQSNVVEAKIWAHNSRIASLIALNPIEDQQTISNIEFRLLNILKGDNDIRTARVTVAVSSQLTATHLDRRLHQIMFDDRDYERPAGVPASLPPPSVSVQNWIDRGYSIVNVQCRDRPKLLFDIVCTITDMDYVVFHGTIDTSGDRARQEFYIRHSDGTLISSEAERQRVIHCLQAAIERRSSEGVRFELCKPDTPGLLSNVTRTFRENSLSVNRAEITTEGEMAADVFYVTDAAGGPADHKIIEAVRERIGTDYLKVDYNSPFPASYGNNSTVKDDRPVVAGGGGNRLFSFGGLVRRNLSYLGLINSCSLTTNIDPLDLAVGTSRCL